MKYFGLIFTMHAREQLLARGIRLDEAWDTFKHPDRTRKNKYGKGIDYEKEFDNYGITLVAVQNPKNEWVVKTAWRTPPLPGTHDAGKKKARRTGLIKKIFLEVKTQLGF